MNRFLIIACFIFLMSCKNEKSNVPLIGFLDLLNDETLAQAKDGFIKALADAGFDEKKNTVKIIYRNAQNDQPALLQSCDYFISKNVDLIATNPTLSTIAAIKKTKNIPVFMMVSPSPQIAGLTDANGNAPSNLFGTYETLEYLDTALMLLKECDPAAKRIATIYNQAEPQAVDALKEIQRECDRLGIELVSQAANSSNETQLVVQSLLAKNVDAFFALPVNVVFSSMEIIVKSCDEVHIPVFTSEEGLVKRGAVAAFGADMFQWGYQSGKQAAHLLKTKSLSGIKPEIVSVRKKVFNKEKIKQFPFLHCTE